ncbi:MAG: nuclear transport factor 2 family protein [Burkholderiaceae bacterium]
MNLEATVRALSDRQDILDCLHRYCRGVDRFDRDLLLSVYHPDAVDDHGVFVGNREAFVDWALAYHAEHQLSHHHMIFNPTIELHGDTAHTEV